MARPFSHTAFFTEQPVRSVAKAMMFWNTAITVVRAAKDMKMKNSAPHTRPKGMLLNTLGRVTKIREGPCPVSPPL